jgi:hypothetical protein
MSPDELRFALVKLGISQAELARLIGVTPRAITLWVGSERSVPGSVSAYLQLLCSLPLGQQQAELARLKKGVPSMKDGIYIVNYLGLNGNGFAMLVFDGGRIYGSDPLRGEYDGTYVTNINSGLVDVAVKVKMPANTPSVIGIQQPFEWILDVTTTMNPANDSGRLNVINNLGQPLEAIYEFMRPLPLLAS